ncbi:probable serine/threonine protein kinase IRE isoform X2 [Phalaenopsis equestris]|uniref:probable serine/threonine protein kinase IRE isoform X2 n=1 Tax=Phalaenopsis equestris TaxID=78828 RepID=UPI0009E29387|nr:probable serine/threonine protein kinase IRE isoform X2 [Phalaenopsis equestris]
MEEVRRVAFDAAKEMQSPRFRAIIRATSGRRKRYSTDVKSFSHELNTKDIMKVIKSKFKLLKEEVNAELGVYAGDLVGILDKATEEHSEWREPLEDLLVISQKCAEMSPDEFWVKCEGIVQNLDDRRHELPMGTLKQVHTRILFILTRCTRLLQFQKEGAYGEEEHVLGLHQFSDLGFYPDQSDSGQALKNQITAKDIKEKIMRAKIQEKRVSLSHLNQYSTGGAESPASRDRISSWKKLPSPAEKNQKKEEAEVDDFQLKKLPSLELPERTKLDIDEKIEVCKSSEMPTKSSADIIIQDTRSETVFDGKRMIICRICDFEIPTMHAEGHFKVCTIADRCDSKGLSVDERLLKLAEIIEKILDQCKLKGPEEVSGVGDSCKSEEFNGPISTRNNEQSSTNAGQCLPNPSSSSTGRRDLGILASSSESISPQSPLMTPQTSLLNFVSTDNIAFHEYENFQQIQSLLDIVRCIESVRSCDYTSLDYLSTCLERLNGIIGDRLLDGLIIETFGRRIEKLLQEKFIQLCGQIDDGNKDASIDEDGSIETDSGRSSRTSPLSSMIKDRTSIEDFEIIKPISRGAFGRVFLAKKRVTGDLFAIKVLKKADMIRKNAVESILAERNILISARNPFVVRFYYSFTSRENLYLVMEYLNGGDLYSLLRNLGCLSEDMARLYIAEVVLALEYLHSLNVIHRDLKPDNLLIARDGHIKLTDFGLSKVGLINSTDDLSGPDVSSAVIFDQAPIPSALRAEKREQRRKQSAVGTPDYLAPEILLGMPHGPNADWWSVGVILFEMLVGIPPFNAEHPQKIFDNIMNRDISWPQIPQEMSHEAYDLINKLLIQNPLQRVGATGAGEVKAHPFFKDINWDMLARQKAAFIPSTQDDEDTSYFESRHAWNSDDAQIHSDSNEIYDMIDTGSASDCSNPGSCEDDDEDEFVADLSSRNIEMKYSFSNFSYKNLSQLASMNYDLITKCSKDQNSNI